MAYPAVTDKAILQGLNGTSGAISKRTGRPIPASLYVAASKLNTHDADWSQWYVTGPQDRPGYVRGPFPLEQVQRLVRSGKLAADAVDKDGNVHSWILKEHAEIGSPSILAEIERVNV